MNNENQFCLNNYLPSTLICDMSLLDTSDSDDDKLFIKDSSSEKLYSKTNSPCRTIMPNRPRPIIRQDGVNNYQYGMSQFNNQNTDPRCKKN